MINFWRNSLKFLAVDKNKTNSYYFIPMKRSYVFYMYVLFFLALTALIVWGSNYYFAPLAKKVRHALHPVLRQSGTIGHLLGIIGSLFMLLLLLYSVRKRFRFARNWGDLNTWLRVHIFLGITGPVMVLMHTVFKFSGIVSLAFWSMVLVVLSGVIGKYIYELIPRSLSGMELNRIELEAEEIGLTFEMRKLIPAGHRFWHVLAENDDTDTPPSIFASLFLFIEQARTRRKFSRLLKEFPEIGQIERKTLLSLVVQRRMFLRKAQLLKQTMRIVHYWHLIHKPFVIIMFLILMIHVYIAVKMGYVWMF